MKSLLFVFNSLDNDAVFEFFWSDLIVAFVGAVLTILIAWGTFLLSRRRQEKQVVASLIRELHARRALAPSKSQARVRNAKRLPDYTRASASVLTMRDEIRRARDRIRPLLKFEEPLAEMSRACNRFLELSAVDPPNYTALLVALRYALAEQISQLSKAAGVEYLAPGEGAF